LSTKGRISILFEKEKYKICSLYYEGTDQVDVKDILLEIDSEISRLQQARALLSGESTPKRGPGKHAAPKKRKLTPEGRKRIAEAMKRRWAERKKQAGAKTTK
jgi:hypothetical protein